MPGAALFRHARGRQTSGGKYTKSALLRGANTVFARGANGARTATAPQGTVLGPLLFLVYINDISTNLSPESRIRLFADDSLLYRTISSPEDCQVLQQDLDALQRWETANKMEFHPVKCETLRITNKLTPIISDYSIHSTTLTVTDAAKYLGVTIDPGLKWTKHHSNVIKKANSTLAFLRRNISSCPKPVKDTCYKTFVRPILEYGCCVWDPHQQNQIIELEKVQKRAARFVTGNYDFTPGNSAKNLTTLGWPTLAERRARNKLNILFKAKSGLVDISTEDLIPSAPGTRRSATDYRIPQSTVDSHLHSFYPSTIRLWNSLPSSTKSCTDSDSFKRALEVG